MNSVYPKTILLVEDDCLAAVYEVKMLEQNGFKVITVDSGEKAIHIINESSNVDLILMDIYLGKGMDGTEAAEKILEKHDIPLIFISCDDAPELIEKTERITSYGYISKNLGEKVLTASIKLVLRLFEAKLKEKAKEKALQESEKKFYSVFENSPNAISITQLPQSKYININKSFERIFGYNKEEVIGKTIDELKILKDPAHRERLLPRLLEGCSIIDEEVEAVTKSGDIINLEISLVLNKINGADYSIAIISDITDRKQAQEALKESGQRLKDLMDSVPVGISVVTHSGLIIDVNNFLVSMLGYDSKESVLSLPVTAHYYDPADRAVLLKLLENGPVKNFEVKLKRKNGSLLWCSLNSTIHKTVNGTIQIINSFIDITDRKLTERLITIENLSSAIIHEIRQPMHAIKVLSEGTLYWEKNDKPRTNEELLSGYEEISHLVNRMEVTIKNMHQMSASPETIERIDLDINRCIKNCTAMFSEKFKSHHITAEYQLSDTIKTYRMSENQFQQVIINLLDNAIKAVNKRPGNDKKIILSTEKGEKEIIITIADTGSGIPDDFKTHIFEPLWTTKDKSENMGLGLFVVNNILQAYNSTIEVCDYPAGGAAFVIRLVYEPINS